MATEIKSFIDVEIRTGRTEDAARRVISNLEDINKKRVETIRLIDEERKKADELEKRVTSLTETRRRYHGAHDAHIKAYQAEQKAAQDAARASENVTRVFGLQAAEVRKSTAEIKNHRDAYSDFAKKTIEETQKMQARNRPALQSFRDLFAGVNNASQSIEENTTRANSATSSLLSTMSRQVMIFAATTLGIRQMIRSYAEFETGLGNVRKTTDMSNDELERFAARIDQISKEIPVSTAELLELAAAAGQMGVRGEENLEKFAVVVAKIGRATDVAGESAAQAFARILQTTGDGVEKIDQFASVIVRLGNNVNATESQILSMANEVARATSAFSVSSTDVAALSAMMVTAGIRAEEGGTTIGRVFQRMAEAALGGREELEKFAKAVGINGEEFQRLYNDDKLAAFQLFLEGIGEHGEQAFMALDDLGLGGARLISVLTPLAKSSEELSRTLEMARDEAEKMTALDEEFNAVIGSWNNQWQRFKNNLESVTRQFATGFMPAMTGLLTLINDFLTNHGEALVGVFSSLTDGVREATNITNDFKTALEEIQRLFAPLSRGFESLGKKIDEAMEPLSKWTENLPKSRASGGLLGGLFDYVRMPTEMFRGFVFEQTGNLINRIAGETEQAAFTTEQYAEGMMGLRDAMLEVESAATALIEPKEELQRITTESEAALAEETRKTEDLIAALGEELALLHMTEEQKALYVAMSEAGANVTAEEAEQIRLLVEAIQKKRDALAASVASSRNAERAQRDLEREVQRSQERIRREFERTERRIGDFFTDLFQNGKSAFDRLEDSFEKMLYNMAGQMAASGILRLFGVGGSMSMGQAAVSALSSSGPAGAIMSAGLSQFGGSFAGLAASIGQKGAVITNAEYEQLMGGKSTKTGFNMTDLKQIGLEIGAGIAGSFAGDALGEAIFGKQAESGWGAMAGGLAGSLMGGPLASFIGSAIGSAIDVAFGGDGFTRSNVGFLAAPTPGLKSEYNIGRDRFDSGLEITGFVRRGDRNEAEKIISLFREMDSAFVSLVRELGGSVKVSQLTGLDEEGTPGSAGAFFGVGSSGGDIRAQLNSFISQLSHHVTGLNDELINSIRAASSAEDAMAILTEAVAKQAEEAHNTAKAFNDNGEEIRISYEKIREKVQEVFGSAGSNYDAMVELEELSKRYSVSIDDIAKALGKSAYEIGQWIDKTETAHQSLIRMEQAVNNMRVRAANELISEYQNVQTFQRSIQNQIYTLLGATPLHDASADITEQLRLLEERRQVIQQNHNEELRQAEALHKRRQQLFENLNEFVRNMQFGQESAIGYPDQFRLAQSQFRSLVAQTRDTSLSLEDRVSAAERLQEFGSSYLSTGRRMFASSSQYRDVFHEVMAAMEEASGLIGTTEEFSATELNDQLISALREIDRDASALLRQIENSLLTKLDEVVLAIRTTAEGIDNAVSLTDGTIAILETINNTIGLGSAQGRAVLQEMLNRIEGNIVINEQSVRLLELLRSSIGINDDTSIEWLRRIHGTVGQLPPSLGQAVVSGTGAWITEMLKHMTPTQIANSIPPNSLMEDAANQAIQEQFPGAGTVEDYRTPLETILKNIEWIKSTSSTEEEAIRRIHSAATANNITSSQVASAIGMSRSQVLALAAKYNLPAFETGGVHFGGARLVGERGPEIEFTPPSVIMNRGQVSGAMFDFAGIESAIRELRTEVVELRNVTLIAASNAEEQRRETNVLLEESNSQTLQVASGIGSKNL